MEKQTTTAESSQTSEKKPEESIEYLKQLLALFTWKQAAANFRKERTELLMQRRSARRWDAKKTARMVRRLTSVTKEREQIVGFLDQVTFRLNQLTTEAKPTTDTP
jgi:hypothetical protein